jgi:TonB-dependent receptor
MKSIKVLSWIVISLIICLSSFDAAAQGRGVVKGVVSDSQSKEPLVFASIGVEGTSFGTTADDEGKFSITLPAGNYQLSFSYLGYNKIVKDLELEPDEVLDLGTIEMEITFFMGQEVVITAMARGQNAAINQQKNSNTIVNVISKERIQELPDQNAAEAIGRLSGVSVVRDGGEGTKVTLRGMAPRLNLITIDGARVPSTDDQDRSVDLSMFSTEALAGIEVYKALRPDMDADAMGGTVNFTARNAREDFGGDVKVQTGYNSLKQELGQYQVSATFENRFFNDKLGAIISGSAQKANRSYEGYTGGWANYGEVDSLENKIFRVSDLVLRNQVEDRYRYGGSVNLDYQLKFGELKFSSNYSRSDRERTRWRRSYSVNSGYQNHDIQRKESYNAVILSNLSGKFKLFNYAELDFSANFSNSNNITPLEERFQFRETGAYEPTDESSFQTIVASAQNKLDQTWLNVAYKDYYDVLDMNNAVQANLKLPLRIGNNIEGYLKFGGKYRDMNRDNDVTREYTGSFIGRQIIEDNAHNPYWAINESNGWILMENFQGDFFAEDFMRHFDEPYFMGPGAEQVNGPLLDYSQLRDFREEYYDDYYRVDPLIDLADYKAGETVTAAYGMYEFNFYDKIMLLGGLRYEHTKNNYRSLFGRPQVDEDGEIINVSGLKDTIGNRAHEQFLPQFHLRYNAFKWADIRLAATKSLSRPNFFSLVPWQRVNGFDYTVERGNPDLEQMTAWNYDVILSFYGNFGLITMGGFYKSLDNIDYTFSTKVMDKELPTHGYDLTMPVNADQTSTIKGLEFDLQTNFRFLPSPFDGFLVNVNYTVLESETFYPYIIVSNLPVFPYTATITDTVRAGRMPGQVADVINLSLGYEKRGFSARLSMVYQGSSLVVSEDAEMGSLARSVGQNEDYDNYSEAFTRWDLIVKQKLNKNFTIYANMNNITNTPERSYMAGSIQNLITRDVVYGMTFDLGIRYKF